jgi:tetratricopeptide (TPR) repeat protein
MNEGNNSEITSIWDEAKGHIESGNYEKAIEIYRYVIVRYADNPAVIEYANAYLGDVYLTIRNLDLAETILKKPSLVILTTLIITICSGSHIQWLNNGQRLSGNSGSQYVWIPVTGNTNVVWDGQF